jgi:uncharacterized protein YcfJ
MSKRPIAILAATAFLVSCSTQQVKDAEKGEWGCMAGTAAGAVAGALVGGVLMKGLGSNNTLRTVGSIGGGVGGAALGDHLACK